MPTFIAYWDCTISGGWNMHGYSGWNNKGFKARLAALRLAVQAAAAEAVNVNLHGNTWIFTGPEYAFGNASTNGGGPAKPAIHVNTTLETQLRNTLAALTNVYGTLLLVPGTIPVWEGQRGARTARNTCYGYYGGAQVWRVDKLRDVGEVSLEESRNRYLVFRSGAGYASVAVNGNTYGTEICADATHGGTLPNQVERHIVVGQGVGQPAIANKSTEFLIVAAAGTYGVYDDHLNAVASYGNEAVGDVTLYYYQA